MFETFPPCISAASRCARPLPHGFTGHVARRVAPFAEAMARQVRFDVNFGFRNQAATDAKQRPGFQPRNRGNGITEIEGEVARVATTELGSDGVSKQEARSEPRRPDR